MHALKTALRRAISWMPRSRALAACCRAYAVHCGEEEFVSSSDPTGAGERRFLREVAHQCRVVLDVGAHAGNWTAALLVHNPGVRVHAFEPADEAYRSLRSRTFTGDVTVHQLALSSRRGSGALHIFGELPEPNSLHNRFGLEDRGIVPATRTQPVELATVDDFCQRQSLPEIDLMKIDTEGHEVDVLHGSLQSLRSGRIRRVQLEYGGTYIDARRLLKDVFAVFSGLDYMLFRVQPDGLLACPRYNQRLENFLYSNYVALRGDVINDTPSARKALHRSSFTRVD